MWRDIEHTHIGLIITEPRHLPLLEPIADRLHRAGSSRRTTFTAVASVSRRPRPIEPDVTRATWVLIFTSGTSSAPKAVICTQRRMLATGERMRQMLAVDADDVGYLCMPLFHSNSLMVGLMPALIAGAAVALARASRRAAGCPTYAATA